MEKTKIAIIALSCRTGGSLVIMRNILKTLKNVSHDEQFMIICPARCGYEEIKMPVGSELFIYEGKHSALRRYWFEEVTLPKIVDTYNPDVIFGIGNTGLARPKVPQVLFIQQAKLFYDKEHYPETSFLGLKRIEVLQSQIRKSLVNTDIIFCQTPIVKKRFVEKYQYPENRIKILLFPPPAEIVTMSDLELPAVFDKAGGNFYVLILTMYLAHRNPGIIIPLCMKYGTQIRDQKIRFITTVEQSDHPKAPKFLKEISKYHLEDVILNVGNISRQNVSRYLINSDLLWLPTLTETLCLPYLEAMRCGLPIFAPDLDFARYVCGSAAVFYNPWDTESIFSKLMLLRKDTSMRKQLIENAKSELCDTEKFSLSWEETTVHIIQELKRIAIYDK